MVVAHDSSLRIFLTGTFSPDLQRTIHSLAEQAGFAIANAGGRALPDAPCCILAGIDSAARRDWEGVLAEFRAGAHLTQPVVLVSPPEFAPPAREIFESGARDLITTDRLDAAALKWAVTRAVECFQRENRQRQSIQRNSELAAVVLASSDAIMSADIEDRVRSWNPGAQALFGYSEDEVLGRTIDELLVPQHLKGERGELYARLRSGHSITGIETERQRKDGSLAAVEINCSPMFAEDGSYKGFTVVFRDISERKHAEEALRLSEEKYARAFSNNPAAIALTTLDEGTFIEVNDTWLEITGFSREEVIGRPSSVVRQWAEPERRSEFAAELRAKGSLHNWEREFRRKAGGTFTAQLSAQLLKIQGTDVILSTFVDISKRKRAEAALRDSEVFTRSILEASPDCLDILTADGKLTYMNANSLGAMGVEDFGSVTGRPYPDIWPESLRPRVERAIATARAGETDRFEGFCVSESGGTRYWDVAVSPVHSHKGEIRHLIVSSRDITDRRRFMMALRENEQTLRLASDAVGLGLVRIDYASGIATPDAIAAALYGIDADVAIPLAELHAKFHPLDRERAEQAIAASLDPQGPGTLAIEHRVIRGDGQALWLSVKKQVSFAERGTGRAAESALLMAFDITARKTVELEVVNLNRRLSKRIEKTERNFSTYFDLIQNNPFGVLLVDSHFRLTQLSQGAHKAFDGIQPLLGRDVAEIIGRTWTEPFASRIATRIRQTLDSGESYTGTETMRLKADPEMVQSYDWRIDRVTLSDGLHGAVCHFYDMTERQKYEDKIRLLMREVNHRSKNILMLVQAVARQTAAQGTEDFLSRFDQRLQALSTSQDLVVQGEWKSVDLESLVRSQLAHFEDLVGTRIAIAGPRLNLKVQAVQPLGMAVHELATNAGKYGAMSNDDGRIDIAWHVERTQDGSDLLAMSWRESGGPTIAAPERLGFGSTVIDRMVRMSLGGQVVIGYEPEGFTWRLECPLPHASETSGQNRQISLRAAAQPVEKPEPRILIVEDEALVAIEIAALMEDAGWSVIGPASTVSRALSLIHEHGCDCAVLDFNLGAETSELIAARLEHLKIPYVTVSGYGRQQIPQRLVSADFLSKPIRPQALIGAVGRCLDKMAVH